MITMIAGQGPLQQAMVRVKGGEWGHVSVVKEPAKHGMAWHVKCTHCGKVFQGNAMRIRSHLLGHPEKVSGCPSCPPEAREELRLSYLAKSQVERKKRQNRTLKTTTTTSSRERASHDSSQENNNTALQEQQLMQGKDVMVEQAFRSMVFQAGGLNANLSPIQSMARPFFVLFLMY